MSTSEQAKIALVIGAGDSTGAPIARRFAREGHVCVWDTPRHDKLTVLVKSIEEAGGKAYGFGSDARKEDQVIALIDQIERDIGPITLPV